MEKNKSCLFLEVLNSSPIIVDTTAIPFNGDIRQLKKDAYQYGKNNLGKYVNKSDSVIFDLTLRNKLGGIKEILSHDWEDIHHLQSIAAIPTIAIEAQYITSRPNEDVGKHFKIKEFRYYLSKIAYKQEGQNESKDYIVKSIISMANDGNRYYDHRLTEIENVKEFISSLVMQYKPDRKQTPYIIKDNRLREILQEVLGV